MSGFGRGNSGGSPGEGYNGGSRRGLVLAALTAAIAGVILGIGAVAVSKGGSSPLPTAAALDITPTLTAIASRVVSPTPSQPAVARAITATPTPASTSATAVPTVVPAGSQGQISPLTVSDLNLGDASAWGAGGTELQACATITGGTASSAMRLRVASSDLKTTIADGPLSPLSEDASACASVPAVGKILPAPYALLLFDEQERRMYSSNFVVSAPPTAPRSPPIPSSCRHRRWSRFQRLLLQYGRYPRRRPRGR